MQLVLTSLRSSISVKGILKDALSWCNIMRMFFAGWQFLWKTGKDWDTRAAVHLRYLWSIILLVWVLESFECIRGYMQLIITTYIIIILHFPEHLYGLGQNFSSFFVKQRYHTCDISKMQQIVQKTKFERTAWIIFESEREKLWKICIIVEVRPCHFVNYILLRNDAWKNDCASGRQKFIIDRWLLRITSSAAPA